MRLAVILIFTSILFLPGSLFAQLGIGTDSPGRDLEIYGTGAESIRIHTQNNFGAATGVEFVKGFLTAPNDWQVANDAGTFKILSGDFKTYSSAYEHLRVTTSNNLGLKTTSPVTKLHVDEGEVATLDYDGYVMLGPKTGSNLIMSPNTIQARNNGSASTLFLHSYGGTTSMSSNVHMGYSTGRFGIGTLNPSKKVHINGNEWHVGLHNTDGEGSPNSWYIGASGSSWAAGDDQLLFSPAANSARAILALRDMSDNDGTNAPVSIRSSSNQELLLDSEEIDSKNGILYINYNSEQDTYLNATGGRVAIGMFNTPAILSIYAPAGEDPLALGKVASRWDLYPTEGDAVNPHGQLRWSYNNALMSSINGTTGQWSAISDRKKKHNISKLNSVLDKVTAMDIYTYAFKHDPEAKKYYGVLAQELETVFPELVKSAGETQGVAYGQLAAVALEAIKEQQELIRMLERQISIIEQSKK